MALRLYTGNYPEAQQLAETKAANAVVAAGGELVSRLRAEVDRLRRKRS